MCLVGEEGERKVGGEEGRGFMVLVLVEKREEKKEGRWRKKEKGL